MCKIRLKVLDDIRRTAASFRADLVRDCSNDAVTAAMFSGFRTLLGRPICFVGTADPVAHTLLIHF